MMYGSYRIRLDTCTRPKKFQTLVVFFKKEKPKAVYYVQVALRKY